MIPVHKESFDEELQYLDDIESPAMRNAAQRWLFLLLWLMEEGMPFEGIEDCPHCLDD